MGKIKYQGGLTKLIASKIGEANKNKFSALLNNNSAFTKLKAAAAPKSNFAGDVVSFSSSRDFSEQVFSMLSFIKFVGVPQSWVVCSDGSHTAFETNFLRDNFSFVTVLKIDFANLDIHTFPFKPQLEPYQSFLADYARAFPLGKKLLYYLQHTVTGPTIFVDSDVLFYPQADILHNLLGGGGNGWFLPDTDWGCLDSRYKNGTARQMYQANSGFMLLLKEFEWHQPAMEFLKSTNYTYEYFTEQTVLHILAQTNRFMPVDPRLFILDSADQFDFSYVNTPQKMALRHYTGPVRHKMWQKNWEWHLSRP